jgi:hypothetical protein
LERAKKVATESKTREGRGLKVRFQQRTLFEVGIDGFVPGADF